MCVCACVCVCVCVCVCACVCLCVFTRYMILTILWRTHCTLTPTDSRAVRWDDLTLLWHYYVSSASTRISPPTLREIWYHRSECQGKHLHNMFYNLTGFQFGTGTICSVFKCYLLLSLFLWSCFWPQIYISTLLKQLNPASPSWGPNKLNVLKLHIRISKARFKNIIKVFHYTTDSL